MEPAPEFQGVNIVLRGQFNTTVFHPAWFAANALIRQQEADAADIKIIHRAAAVFDAEWLGISVQEDRFQAATLQEPYFEALRDLVVGVLNLQSHVPLTAMGINREFHYGLQSARLGTQLVIGSRQNRIGTTS